MPTALSDRLGRYQLVKKIATGGMAEIFLAKVAGPAGFEKQVVIKRILPHLADDPQFVGMFLDEARVAAMLSHPHIAQVYDFGREEGTYYLAMEVVNGPDLRRLTTAITKLRRRIPPEICARILAQASDALDYAHNAVDPNGVPLNIIHRDVSPQNILISFDGAAKLVDFGVAKAAGRGHRTEAGSVKGKFAYMAPEQLDNRPLDKRADVFGLGLVLYEIACGMPAYRGDSDIAVVKAAADARFLPPKEIRPDLPDDLANIIVKALQKDRENRYQSARDLQKALDAWLFRCGTPVPPHEIADFLREVRDASGDPLSSTAGLLSTASFKARPSTPAPAAALDDAEAEELSSGDVVALRTDEIEAQEMALDGPALFGDDDGKDDLARAEKALFGGAGQDSESTRRSGPPKRPGSSSRPNPSAALAQDDIPTQAIPAIADDLPFPAPSAKGSSPRLTPEDILTDPSAGPESSQTGAKPLFDLAQAKARPRHASTPEFGRATRGGRSWLVPGLIGGAAAVGIAIGAVAALRGGEEKPKQPPAVAETKDEAKPAAAAPASSPAGPTATAAPPPAARAEPLPASPPRPEPAKPVRGKRSHEAARATLVANAEPPRPAPPPPAEQPKGDGVLTIGSSPWTEVYVDGRSAGSTPVVKLPFAAGKHEVRLVNREKGIERKVSVDVKPGQETKEYVKIGKGTVNFRVIPWAEVSVDGRDLGATPLPPQELYEGTYTVTFVNGELGRKETRTLTVRPDSEQTLKLDLRR